MRSSFPIWLAAFFLGVAAASAQTESYTARVKAVAAEVRSGPSQDARVYPTNRLKRGDIITVRKEREDGWLEIAPPTGSFSWVNQLFVTRADAKGTIWTVTEENTKVFYGSSIWDKQPDKIASELRRGAQVVSVGPKFSREDAGGVWLPIKPPVREVRYVRAEDVEKIDDRAAARATPTGRSGDAPNDATLPPSNREVAEGDERNSQAPLRSPSGNADVRIADAQRAERNGNRDQAIRLWIEVGRDYEKSGNSKLAQQCYARADWLKQQQASRLTPRPQNGCYTPCNPAPACRPYAGPTGRLEPVPSRTSSNPADLQWKPAAGSAAPPPATAPTPGTTVFQGYLSRASNMVDDKPAFLLQTRNNSVIGMVVGDPGLPLDRYVQSTVELQGSITYRADLRANLIHAVNVQPLTNR